MEFSGFNDFKTPNSFSGGDIVVAKREAYMLVEDEVFRARGFSLVRLGDVPRESNYWCGIMDRFPRCTSKEKVKEELDKLFGDGTWQLVPRAYILIATKQNS